MKKLKNCYLNPHSQLMTFIEEIMESKNTTLIESNVIESLLKLFEQSFLSIDIFERTHLNFSLFRLGILYNSGFEFDTKKIVRTILNNIKSKPHHSSIFCEFLSNFKKDEIIINELCKFIFSENNIYNWQEMIILKCILRSDISINKNIIQQMLKIINNRNKHFSVISFAILIIGKFRENRDRNILIDYYNSNQNDFVKRAIILSLQEIGISSRNDFYNKIKRSNPEYTEFINYVKGLKNPLYF